MNKLRLWRLSLAFAAILGFSSHTSASDCEIVRAHEASYIVTDPSGSVVKKFCVTATIKSFYGVGRFVKDLNIRAHFEDGTFLDSKVEPLDPMNMSVSARINSGETYTGRACFSGDFPIVKLECRFD